MIMLRKCSRGYVFAILSTEQIKSDCEYVFKCLRAALGTNFSFALWRIITYQIMIIPS